jgi:hypothetical protein
MALFKGKGVETAKYIQVENDLEAKNVLIVGSTFSSKNNIHLQKYSSQKC